VRPPTHRWKLAETFLDIECHIPWWSLVNTGEHRFHSHHSIVNHSRNYRRTGRGVWEAAATTPHCCKLCEDRMNQRIVLNFHGKVKNRADTAAQV